MSEKLERIVNFAPAFDRRNPDPKKDYGVHGVTLRMILKGEKGATQFVLYTNWQLPHVQEEFDDKAINLFSYKPLPADLGYHSPSPQYEGQTKRKCDILGGDCYYDGSGLNAERVFDILLQEGDEGVWKELERYYNVIFNEEKE